MARLANSFPVLWTLALVSAGYAHADSGPCADQLARVVSGVGKLGPGQNFAPGRLGREIAESLARGCQERAHAQSFAPLANYIKSAGLGHSGDQSFLSSQIEWTIKAIDFGAAHSAQELHDLTHQAEVLLAKIHAYNDAIYAGHVEAVWPLLDDELSGTTHGQFLDQMFKSTAALTGNVTGNQQSWVWMRDAATRPLDQGVVEKQVRLEIEVLGKLAKARDDGADFANLKQGLAALHDATEAALRSESRWPLLRP